MDPVDILPAGVDEGDVGAETVAQDSKDVHDVECDGEALVDVGEGLGGSNEVSNSVWVASSVEVLVLAESGPSDATPKVDDDGHAEHDQGEEVTEVHTLERPAQHQELVSQSHGLREAIVLSESLAEWGVDSEECSVTPVNPVPDVASWDERVERSGLLILAVFGVLGVVFAFTLLVFGWCFLFGLRAVLITVVLSEGKLGGFLLSHLSEGCACSGLFSHKGHEGRGRQQRKGFHFVVKESLLL